MSVLRQISVILYRLKRNYPAKITIRKTLATYKDLETGEVTRPNRSFDIRRAIALPERRIPDFIYDLSYIAANKNFAYGGQFSSSTRLVIIDAKDVPRDFNLSIGDEVIFDKQLHALKSMTDTANKKGHILTVTTVGEINE